MIEIKLSENYIDTDYYKNLNLDNTNCDNANLYPKDNVDGHTCCANESVMYEYENKNNKLCSGYFCSFIIPPVGSRYKKQFTITIAGIISVTSIKLGIFFMK